MRPPSMKTGGAWSASPAAAAPHDMPEVVVEENTALRPLLLPAPGEHGLEAGVIDADVDGDDARADDARPRIKKRWNRCEGIIERA